MAEEVAEATESLPKEAGLVGLDGPLDQLDLTKMLAESFEPQEQDRSEETSPGGDAVEEADSEMEYAGYISKDDFYDQCTTMTGSLYETQKRLRHSSSRTTEKSYADLVAHNTAAPTFSKAS